MLTREQDRRWDEQASSVCSTIAYLFLSFCFGSGALSRNKTCKTECATFDIDEMDTPPPRALLLVWLDAVFYRSTSFYSASSISLGDVFREPGRCD
jgi:hypothetical protein